MNEFILKHNITSEKLFAYLSFYYVLSFFCASSTPKTLFYFLAIFILVSVPLAIVPRVVKSAVLGLGESTHEQAKDAEFKVKCICAFFSVLIIVVKFGL
jgi:hypothetical protein